MLNLELARTIHEERARSIEARSRIVGLLAGLGSRTSVVGRSSVGGSRHTRRRVGPSDGGG